MHFVPLVFLDACSAPYERYLAHGAGRPLQFGSLSRMTSAPEVGFRDLSLPLTEPYVRELCLSWPLLSDFLNENNDLNLSKTFRFLSNSLSLRQGAFLGDFIEHFQVSCDSGLLEDPIRVAAVDL